MNRAIANLTRPGAVKEFGLRLTIMLAALKLYDTLHEIALDRARDELAAEAAFLAAAEVHLSNHPTVIEHEPVAEPTAAAQTEAEL